MPTSKTLNQISLINFFPSFYSNDKPAAVCVSLKRSIKTEQTERLSGEDCYAGTFPRLPPLCQSAEEHERQGHPTSLQFYTVFLSNQYCPT